MIGPVENVGNLNQDDPRGVQDQTEKPQGMPAEDVTQGKVNPVEPPENLSDESVSNEEKPLQDTSNQGSAEGSIIDVLG